MAKTQSQLIDYFRRCYRADNYGIAISDVSRLSKTRKLDVTERDDLACGILPRIPLTNSNVPALIKQVDKYRKERLLVYACFFVYGRIESNGSFSSSRNLNSPLIYFPATLFQYEDNYFEKEIYKYFSEKEIGAHKIRVAAPYGFQGEERDLMVLSMSVDDDSSRAAAYLNRGDMFNVAITRAKERMHVYYSVDPASLSAGNLFKQFLKHDHLNSSDDKVKVMRCEFSNDLCTILSSIGYKCWIGFEIAGVEIDVVCQKDGFLLGIDLIGFPGDFHDYYGVETYKTLFRAGIVVMPMPYSSWIQDKNVCIGMINTYIERA